MWPWGKKLASASLFVFCTLDELRSWVQLLCAEKGLGCISFSGLDLYGAIANAPDEIVLRNDTYAMFLYPVSNPPEGPLRMNDVQARPWGWIYIHRSLRLIGLLENGLQEEGSMRVLLLTQIYSEDFDKETVHPTKYVRWLKRRLKNVVKSGVIGRNIVTGDEDLSRNICYTPGAYELYQSGVVWKQFHDDRMSFEPIGDNSS